MIKENRLSLIEQGGIYKRNRVLLDRLNRQVKGPFTIIEAANIMELPVIKARPLILYWVARRWITRIKKSLYMTVPLGTVKPKERKEDPWIVAAMVFDPCYVGGWSACEYWGLTDQIFNNLVIYSSKRLNRKKVIIQNTTYIVKLTNKTYFFGLKPEWRGSVKIMVSDASRTIVDILNEPYSGGGIRNVIEILRDYFSGDKRNDNDLLKYISRFGNKTIYKRLGYILEAMKIEGAGNIIGICKKNISSGLSKLDPQLHAKGRILRRWNLIINAHIERLS